MKILTAFVLIFLFFTSCSVRNTDSEYIELSHRNVMVINGAQLKKRNSEKKDIILLVFPKNIMKILS